MPSYIELDKQLTIPASSDVGKTILSVNTSNELTLTNNFGVTTRVADQFTTVTPNEIDFQLFTSYGLWVNGKANYNVDNKWEILDNVDFETDYITLSLESVIINGVSYSKFPIQSVTVSAGTVTYRDDGYGVVPVNYIDFINDVFSSYGLYTRISGETGNMIANYCRTDNFILVFKEIGVLNDSVMQTVYYLLETKNGVVIQDSFSENLRNFGSSLPWF